MDVDTMTDIIYDTLMNNTQHEQFDINEVEDLSVDLQKDEISFKTADDDGTMIPFTIKVERLPAETNDESTNNDQVNSIDRAINVISEQDSDGGEVSDEEVKEAREIAQDCHDYFIKGKTDKDDGGLNNLFDEVYHRTGKGGDYYMKVSELCLNNEHILADPDDWDEDWLIDFATDFKRIVPADDPNYGYEVEVE